MNKNFTGVVAISALLVSIVALAISVANMQKMKSLKKAMITEQGVVTELQQESAQNQPDQVQEVGVLNESEIEIGEELTTEQNNDNDQGFVELPAADLSEEEPAEPIDVEVVAPKPVTVQ